MMALLINWLFGQKMKKKKRCEKAEKSSHTSKSLHSRSWEDCSGNKLLERDRSQVRQMNLRQNC